MARAATLVAVIFGALTILMTWPLAAHLGDAVLGPPGDNFEYPYKLWWFAQAWLRGQSPFFIPDVFYPYGYPVALSETTLTHMALGLPLTLAGGEVISYNLLIIGSFVLSGLGMWLWVTQLTGQRLAAAVAGMAFTYAPYRMAHAGAGHLPLLGTAWFPLLFLSLDNLIEWPTRRRAVIAGFFFALLALSSWYYAYSGALFGLLYLALRGRPWRQHLMTRRFLGKGFLALATAGVLILPALLPVGELARLGEGLRRSSLSYVDQWSASPADFLVPSAMHPLWGEAIARLYRQNIHEGLIFVGFVVLVLAMVALRLWPSAHRYRLAILVAVAIILAWGTTLHWADEVVRIPVSDRVAQSFERIMSIVTGRLALNRASYTSLHVPGTIVIPLPMLLLYLFLPFFNAMRVWSRFAIIAQLGLGALAAGGLAVVMRGRRWIAYLAMGGVLLEFLVAPYPFGLTSVRPQPVDEWLHDHADGGAVIQMPIERSWRGPYLYMQRVHGHPIAYGYGTFMPRPFREAQAILARFPSTETLALLRQWGIRYIITSEKWYGNRWPDVERQIIGQQALRLQAILDDRPVYWGDRLIRLVVPTDRVPPTALVAGERAAYLVDRLHIYELRD
jgi:hypothetical protein